MLPLEFPRWRTVYEFFRKWTSIGLLDNLLEKLVSIESAEIAEPKVAILDSPSVKSAHPSSQKGIDGGKKIKGIKRHIAVNDRGLLLGLAITAANVHDSKAAFRLVGSLGDNLQSLSVIKGDMGYRGELVAVLESCFGIELRCVKSNFGTSEFRPLDGRWVVERTFAWLDTFSRLCRNYEHYLHTARGMTIVAFVMLLLRRV